MPKHLSQQRKRHIERQQRCEWWNEYKKGDVRTLTEEQIKNIPNPKTKALVLYWLSLKQKGY